jgi:hypothetical protein
MPAIQYLAELDKVNAQKALGPIIHAMNERELRVALLYIIYGIDIYQAIEDARETPFEKKR